MYWEICSHFDRIAFIGYWLLYNSFNHSLCCCWIYGELVMIYHGESSFWSWLFEVLYTSDISWIFYSFSRLEKSFVIISMNKFCNLRVIKFSFIPIILNFKILSHLEAVGSSLHSVLSFLWYRDFVIYSIHLIFYYWHWICSDQICYPLNFCILAYFPFISSNSLLK